MLFFPPQKTLSICSFALITMGDPFHIASSSTNKHKAISNHLLPLLQIPDGTVDYNRINGHITGSFMI